MAGIEDIAIVYEDEHVIGVNKPAGIAVHGTGRGGDETVADWVMKHRPALKDIGEPGRTPAGEMIHRPGIVHRLDKDTSGILVIAKNQETFESLKKQFAERRVEKEYRAIVHGVPKEKEGTIALPIGRSKKDVRKKSVHPSARGRKREARTDYRVLRSGGGFSYLSVFPKTGRTHQIRVHLQSLNNPVVCDRLYAARRACPTELGRLGLHAHAITFSCAGKIIRLEAPMPREFAGLLAAAMPEPSLHSEF